MEGKIKIKYDNDDDDNYLDFISILLENGYTLTLDVSKDKQELEILYCKGEVENGRK